MEITVQLNSNLHHPLLPEECLSRHPNVWISKSVYVSHILDQFDSWSSSSAPVPGTWIFESTCPQCQHPIKRPARVFLSDQLSEAVERRSSIPPPIDQSSASADEFVLLSADDYFPVRLPELCPLFDGKPASNSLPTEAASSHQASSSSPKEEEQEIPPSSKRRRKNTTSFHAQRRVELRRIENAINKWQNSTTAEELEMLAFWQRVRQLFSETFAL